MKKSEFEVLGINEDASEKEIISAFRIKCLNYNMNIDNKLKSEIHEYSELLQAFESLIDKYNPKENSPIRKFSNNIDLMTNLTEESTYKKNDVDKFISKLKSSINKIANSHEILIGNDYFFIKEYFNYDDLLLNKEISSFISPIKDAIYSFLIEQEVNTTTLKNIVIKHIEQMKRSDDFSKLGNHLSQDYIYLTDYYKLIGKRLMLLGYLIVHIETLEEYS
jgi:hypothetical protein